MASIYAVPGRVIEGSEQPIRSMENYRAAAHRWRSDPDGFWLETTRSSIEWSKTPTLGLTGGYHTIYNAPFSGF